MVQLEVEFVAGPDQEATSCGKLSIVLHGTSESTNMIHLDEDFEIVPRHVKSHRYIVECVAIGQIHNMQIFIVNLKNNWRLREVIIHRQVLLKHGEDEIFEKSFYYDSEYIKATSEQKIITLTAERYFDNSRLG